jgi:hypothetical protein
MTTEQVHAGLKSVIAVAETIRELGRVPSGHLYARLMGVLSMDAYERIIAILMKQGLVQRTAAHELVWVG